MDWGEAEKLSSELTNQKCEIPFWKSHLSFYKPVFKQIHGCVSVHGRENLHMLNDSINAELLIQVYAAIFSRKGLAYISKAMLN